MKITITSDQDWGCEYTEADAEAFSAAIVAAVAAAYPSATVEHNYGLGRLRVVTDVRDDDVIHEVVRECLDAVWEAGEFWPEQDHEPETVYTTEVYYDDQDPDCTGWAYRCDEHGPEAGRSGGLDEDDLDSESRLTRGEAAHLAWLALAEDDAAGQVRVYWHGEQDPIVFARGDLPLGADE